jgi:hypothetical protein
MTTQRAKAIIDSIIQEGLTLGIRNALKRGRVKEVCGKCDFAIPIYPDRYSNKCPSCGETLKDGKHVNK